MIDATSSTLGFFASEVVRLRKARGLSQPALAKLLRYSPSQVAKIETAERIPKAPLAVNLDEIFGTGEVRDVVVIYSASSPDELAYSARLQKLGIPVLVVAPSTPDELPHNWSYLGASPLTAESLARAVPDVASRAALVSGPPTFVHSLRASLRRAGAQSVRTDLFTGYTKPARARYKGAPVPKEPAQAG